MKSRHCNVQINSNISKRKRQINSCCILSCENLFILKLNTAVNRNVVQAFTLYKVKKMSYILALRHLSKSMKYAVVPKNHDKLLLSSPTLTPAQHIVTQINSAAQQKTTTTPTDAVNNDDWRIIYRLPLISLASAFNRVKIPFGVLNGVTIPAVYALEQASQFPPTTTALVAAIGLTSCCTLAISSFFIRNLIGIIYINDNNDKLRFAYVDYWGKRQDTCIELNDLIPESEKPRPAKFDFYQSVKLYSDNKVNYKLLQRFGSIEDRETFVTIFGE